ncbi:NUDIX hydrolase [Marivita sp. S2033]|uniref:NUDIX hydrolase n=1 Tax=Marivita sp. S2033 TaxID=3373187 RepID=UPI003982D0FC
MRWTKGGKFQILMVTSRDTGRWIMPKGWTMDGKKPWTAAEIEALEEAGALGYIGHEVIGTYTYRKKLDDGSALKCKVDVYPMMVERLKRNWKERDERTRKWFSAKGAAKRVNEPELAELLQTLAKKPAKQPVIKEFLKAS